LLQVPDTVAVTVREVGEKHCGACFTVKFVLVDLGNLVPPKAAKRMEMSRGKPRYSKDLVQRIETGWVPAGVGVQSEKDVPKTIYPEEL